nr:UPF0280 family protein [Methanobrevibacter sp. 87.7]
MNKNKIQQIEIDETHIRLITDLENHNLDNYIIKIRKQLKDYIYENPEFLTKLTPYPNKLKTKYKIIELMDNSSKIANVGPMAAVAGTISELCLNHLILKGSKLSSVENGGDIAIINNKKMVCGIYTHTIKDIGFELKPRKKPLGICTSSSKIGHSISFGNSESVTILTNQASIADGLATSIANDVKGETTEDAINNGLESAEKYKEFYNGAIITVGDLVGTIGKLPKIVSTEPFDIDY